MSNLIERKIQKYTHKLRRSATRDRANLYQQKLRYYNNLTQSGGGVEDILNELKKLGDIGGQLKGKVESLEKQIKEKKDKIEDLEKTMRELPEGVDDEKYKQLENEKEELKKELKGCIEEYTDLGKKREDELVGLEEKIKSSDTVLDEILNLVKPITAELTELVKTQGGGGCGGTCGLPLLPMHSEY